MKSCMGCMYAKWDKRANGTLHPSGNGVCVFRVKQMVLPASMHFIHFPFLGGGHINRRHEFKEHCPCYEREK